MKKENIRLALLLMSERTKDDTLRRGAIRANFETLGSKFSQRD
ncbi:hypothetical protein HMPREF9378_1383 [Streptococcus sanguinis SK1 = NCTC 7863]|jgi:hypothetical protein|uniref:Uncharacterized protein n=1 Tax=Streptococcus sanguinis SK405 TaxID=888817 RepID=A0ABC9PCH9_STRSA|nr:hypothetical protein [Streptococcus sanguinis]EGC24318.1 hypothetical protein HMPREF9390_1383 [Streptococcus sanguinis SK405]EGC27991.1 hypothetical protein HMPREF9392_0512 [Streptococcus sanguinis SK678]EGF06962.1 hypothetical protein HMPREF9378_1383 [Streptococcus sanguinis SK1 = NCTC 7863]